MDLFSKKAILFLYVCVLSKEIKQTKHKKINTNKTSTEIKQTVNK